MKRENIAPGLSAHARRSAEGMVTVGSRRARAALKAFGLFVLATGLLWSRPVTAISVTLLGKGQLPSGEFIVMTQLTLNPGDTVPWHYHPGTGLRVVLSGTLTEDEGCGNPLIAHPAGSAFEEDPGHVHRVFNSGSDPVVVLRTDVLPPCYVNQGTIFVNGPRCEGHSGKSHLEPIAPCSSQAGNSAVRKSAGLIAASRHKQARASSLLSPISATASATPTVKLMASASSIHRAEDKYTGNGTR